MFVLELLGCSIGRSVINESIVWASIPVIFRFLITSARRLCFHPRLCLPVYVVCQHGNLKISNVSIRKFVTDIANDKAIKFWLNLGENWIKN